MPSSGIQWDQEELFSEKKINIKNLMTLSLNTNVNGIKNDNVSMIESVNVSGIEVNC